MVSLPFAQRLAFDPVRGRAWRVCAECGEWNLLGADEARPVVAEASQLMAAVPLRAVDRGIDKARVENLALLRVDLEPGDVVDPAVEARQEALVVRQDRMAQVAGGLGLLALAWLLFQSIVPGWMPATRVLAIACPIWSAQLVAQAYQQWRLGKGNVRRSAVASAILLGVGLALGVASDPLQARISLLGWPFIAAMMVWINTGMPVGWIRLPSGRRMVITRRIMDRTRLTLDDGGSLRLMLPNGAVLDRSDGVALLRDLLDGYSWETGTEVQVAGLQLARGTDPLPRVLELLRPALEAEPEGLPLGRLPEAWRAALDLALAASGGAPGRLTALAEKAREAQQVAAIAESLDDHERLP